MIDNSEVTKLIYNNETLRKAILDFSMKEHTEESITFILAVNELQRMPVDIPVTDAQKNAVIQKYKEIYEKYIKKAAPSEINISSELTKPLHKLMENSETLGQQDPAILINIFNSAQRSIERTEVSTNVVERFRHGTGVGGTQPYPNAEKIIRNALESEKIRKEKEQQEIEMKAQAKKEKQQEEAKAWAAKNAYAFIDANNRYKRLNAMTPAMSGRLFSDTGIKLSDEAFSASAKAWVQDLAKHNANWHKVQNTENAIDLPTPLGIIPLTADKLKKLNELFNKFDEELAAQKKAFIGNLKQKNQKKPEELQAIEASFDKNQASISAAYRFRVIANLSERTRSENYPAVQSVHELDIKMEKLSDSITKKKEELEALEKILNNKASILTKLTNKDHYKTDPQYQELSKQYQDMQVEVSQLKNDAQKLKASDPYKKEYEAYSAMTREQVCIQDIHVLRSNSKSGNVEVTIDSLKSSYLEKATKILSSIEENIKTKKADPTLNLAEEWNRALKNKDYIKYLNTFGEDPKLQESINNIQKLIKGIEKERNDNQRALEQKKDNEDLALMKEYVKRKGESEDSRAIHKLIDKTESVYTQAEKENRGLNSEELETLRDEYSEIFTAYKNRVEKRLGGGKMGSVWTEQVEKKISELEKRMAANRNVTESVIIMDKAHMSSSTRTRADSSTPPPPPNDLLARAAALRSTQQATLSANLTAQAYIPSADKAKKESMGSTLATTAKAAVDAVKAATLDHAAAIEEPSRPPSPDSSSQSEEPPPPPPAPDDETELGPPPPHAHEEAGRKRGPSR